MVMFFSHFRAKVFEDIDRMIHPEHVIDREVYNLDVIKARSGANFISDNSNVSNRDEFRWVNKFIVHISSIWI